MALIVLGPKRLPDLAKALGKGVREFREALSEGEASRAAEPVPGEASTAQAPPPEATVVGEHPGSDNGHQQG